MNRPALILAALAAQLLTACASQKPAPTAATYLDHYNQGQYAAAKTEAQAFAAKATGPDRDNALLIAGLSAQASHQHAEAKRILTPLTSNNDPQIAGRALAALGLIARDESDHIAAASLLTNASKKLTGDEAAKAAMYAGDAFTALNRRDDARERYTSGLALASSDPLKQTLRERIENKRFTIQTGSFASRTNAEKAAGDLRMRARTAGCGTPRVLPAMVNGKLVYAVQTGEFVSRQDAAVARTKLGVEGVVMAIEPRPAER